MEDVAQVPERSNAKIPGWKPNLRPLRISLETRPSLSLFSRFSAKPEKWG